MDAEASRAIVRRLGLSGLAGVEQNVARWAPGSGGEITLLNVDLSVSALWFVCAYGPVRFTLSYGTNLRARRVLSSPISATLPGALTLNAQPLVDPVQVDTIARASMVPITAPIECSVLRSPILTPGPLPEGARSYTALTASTVSVQGVGVVVPVGNTILLLDPSTLVAGSGVASFDP